MKDNFGAVVLTIAAILMAAGLLFVYVFLAITTAATFGDLFIGGAVILLTLLIEFIIVKLAWGW